ncbi:endonuclease domain-containing 1 protein [Sorex araneus]|uniref:endonuclease domain-containing 1 protein n=1 Tax=Sorex araneus TaxID=42254 RepID=UPI0024333CBC|nr:endonuclease domain-containing 1 protein [Sorex araneus]
MGPARLLALGCLALLAAPGQPRLLRDDEPGFGDCDGFFYAGVAPSPRPDDSLRLCQRSGGAAHFATVYSAAHRAPLYSAFRAPSPTTPADAPRPLLEPQIDDLDSGLEELVDEAEAVAAGSQLGSRQALSADYEGSEYEPGQLFPWPLGGGKQEAGFALTNAVPMSPSFRERWHGNLHGLLQRALLPQCEPASSLFLLAGAVPSEHTLQGRVAVPELLWLAACCAVPGGGWAMGFVQHPRAGAVIEDVMVRDLEKLLPSRPQLFHDNCGESEQDTEKMKKILETVNLLQEEERAAWAQGVPQPPPEPAPQPLQEVEDTGGPLGRLLGLLCSLVLGALRAVLQLLWFVVGQVVQAVEGGLYRLGSAAVSYVLAIGGELLGIPWKVLQVLLRLLRALLRVLCCLLKAVCRVLGLPARVLLDVAAFPVYTVGAIPGVCRDIAAGLGGALVLLFNMASGTVGGLLQVLFGVCRRVGPRAPVDSAGDF